MCGFAGIVNFRSPRLPPLDPALLEAMGAPVAHRGPDGRGRFISVDGRVGLIHHRLAIVDPAGGGQPMANEDGSIQIVFNGEIYNHVELRGRLLAAGHRFASRCDTEVIVHQYEQDGPECVRRFRGQFALALVDLPRRRLLLACDRLGQKPLYWIRLSDGAFLFGSDPRCLLAHPGLSKTFSPASLCDYLRYGYVPAPASIWSGIKKPPPGHYLLYDELAPAARQLQSVRYWQLPVARFGGSLAEAVHAVRQRLIESVSLRLRADVEVGLFLSGGTDSAVIASIVRRLLGRPIRTFTVGSVESGWDERAAAGRVARELGTEHREFIVQPDALLDVLDDLVENFAEPFADSSAIPTFHVARQTRPHVKVALSGDGGDECFAGYDRYRAARLHERLRFLRPLAGGAFLRRFDGPAQRGLRARAGRFVAGLAMPLPRAYCSWVGLFSDEQLRDLLRDGPPARSRLDLAGLFARELEHWPDPVQAACRADLQSYLPYDLLTKVDRATMRLALECRDPFLDHELIELAASLPGDWKLRRGTSKWILRQAFKDIVPASVWGRPKRGFGLPLDAWFRDPLLPLLRESVGFLPDDLFNRAAIDALIAAHQSARREHSQRLWALLWLGRWWKRFMWK